MQDIEIDIEIDIEKCSLELMKKPLLRKASWKLVDTSIFYTCLHFTNVSVYMLLQPLT